MNGDHKEVTIQAILIKMNINLLDLRRKELKMRVAIVLRGGVSLRKTSHSLTIAKKGTDSYVNLQTCAETFLKFVVKPNSTHDVQILLQSWNKDLEQNLIQSYSPRFSRFHSSIDYHEEIIEMTVRSFENFQKLYPNPSITLNEYLEKNSSGVSQALSLKLAAEIALEAEDRNHPFDAVLFYRPDLVLLKPMKFDSYSRNSITCNNFMDRMGDFHFFVPRKLLDSFSGLFDSIEDGNYHEVHMWIKRYLEEFRHLDLVQDNIKAGIDQEVIRKARKTMEFATLYKFGLSAAEWAEYPD